MVAGGRMHALWHRAHNAHALLKLVLHEHVVGVLVVAMLHLRRVRVVIVMAMVLHGWQNVAELGWGWRH